MRIRPIVCGFVLASVMSVFMGSTAAAEEFGWGAPQPRPGQIARPCGPDSLTGPLRNLVPQGFMGASFREACITHDACYDTYGVDRLLCERNFKKDLVKACDQSDRPVLCRTMARFMGTNVARFGKDAFDSAQNIAKGKLLAGGRRR